MSSSVWELATKPWHSPQEYNYERYQAKHLLMNLWWTLRGRGIQPGHVAPDFELSSTTGDRVRLSALRGRPVVLRFGSFTWPITAGGVPPLKQLYERYSNRVHFVDVFIRQAHPGERRGAYESDEQKFQEAHQYQRDEALPWPVLVDDFAGTTHQTYGNMSDPVY